MGFLRLAFLLCPVRGPTPLLCVADSLSRFGRHPPPLAWRIRRARRPSPAPWRGTRGARSQFWKRAEDLFAFGFDFLKARFRTDTCVLAQIKTIQAIPPAKLSALDLQRSGFELSAMNLLST
jgi:hypothetical protein